jgi:integrase
LRGDNIDEKNLLQFAQEQGIIDITLIQQQYEQMKREKIIESHKIWQASDGRWKTYVTVAGKQKLLAKTSREVLEDEIIKAYADPKVNFKDCFDAWINEKLSYGEIQKQTYDRYIADYKRYIKGTNLEHKEVKKIDELYLEAFIKQKIADDRLTAKNWGNMRILISGAMIYARKHGYTDIRISLFLAELQLSSKIFKRVIVKDEEQVFNPDEEEKIERYIKDNPDVLSLGVALTFCTGLRVGEMAALKWEDYKGDFLSVERTEVKYIGKNGERIAEVRPYTKGKTGHRQVVLSDKARAIIEQLKTITGQYEYMFTRDGERIKAVWLSLEITRLCKELYIPHKSFHKIRKTYGTKLLDAGIGDKIITNQMGHTEILTTKTYYYFNNKQVSEIKEVLNSVT